MTRPRIATSPSAVSGAGVTHHGSRSTQPVSTTQIAPTILQLRGLNPRALQGVREDGTPTLTGVR